MADRSKFFKDFGNSAMEAAMRGDLSSVDYFYQKAISYEPTKEEKEIIEESYRHLKSVANRKRIDMELSSADSYSKIGALDDLRDKLEEVRRISYEEHLEFDEKRAERLENEARAFNVYFFFKAANDIANTGSVPELEKYFSENDTYSSDISQAEKKLLEGKKLKLFDIAYRNGVEVCLTLVGMLDNIEKRNEAAEKAREYAMKAGFGKDDLELLEKRIKRRYDGKDVF